MNSIRGRVDDILWNSSVKYRRRSMEDQNLDRQRHLATSSMDNLEKTSIKRSSGISSGFSIGHFLGRAVTCCFGRFPMTALNPNIPDMTATCVFFFFFFLGLRRLRQKTVLRSFIYLLRKTGGLKDGHTSIPLTSTLFSFFKFNPSVNNSYQAIIYGNTQVKPLFFFTIMTMLSNLTIYGQIYL